MPEMSRSHSPGAVSVSEEQFVTYTRLARRLCVSNTELVRHALEVYSLLRSEIKHGAEVLIYWPDGSIQKVVGV